MSAIRLRVWSEFLNRAELARPDVAQLLAAFDSGVLLRTLYVLVVMELGSRRVLLADCTAHPDSGWVVQQARNLAWGLQDRETPIRFVIRDRDSKYTDGFDAVFRSEGVRVLRTPFRSPRANAHLERLVKTVRRECLDWLLIASEGNLRRVLSEYFDHYNRARPHLVLSLRPPSPAVTSQQGPVVRRQGLHGLINEYSRAA